jgi:hypothetical protein
VVLNSRAIWARILLYPILSLSFSPPHMSLCLPSPFLGVPHPHPFRKTSHTGLSSSQEALLRSLWEAPPASSQVLLLHGATPC